MEIVSIPENQVGRLLGKGGRNLRTIEKMGGVHLDVSDDGTVKVRGEDSLDVMTAANVVRAFGFGFRRDDALELFQPNCQLTVLNLSDVVPENDLERMKGRIIGSGGKVKKHLQYNLDVHLQVTDGYVAAIGTPDRLRILKEVLERLLGGATHSSAYKHLDKRLASLENI